jgi:hypothetical protein
MRWIVEVERRSLSHRSSSACKRFEPMFHSRLSVTMRSHSSGVRLPEASHVRLEVFDLLGRSVALLVDEMRPAGEHRALLTADALTAGTYVYRLVTERGVKTNTLTVVR